MNLLHVSVHTAALCELVVTELALDSLDLEMDCVDVSVQHVYTAVRLGTDVAVDGGSGGDLARSEGAVPGIHVIREPGVGVVTWETVGW